MKKICWAMMLFFHCFAHSLMAQYSGTLPVTMSIPATATSVVWYKNNVVISGATGVTYAASTVGEYYATYTDGTTTCATDRSLTFVLANAGSNVTLTGSTNNGTGTDYQWYNGTTSIAAATTANYTATTGGMYNLAYNNGNCVIKSADYYVFLIACSAGTTAPSLSATTLSNTCPTATVNLNSLHNGTIPNGARLRWHTVTTNPTAADSVATPSVLTASGTYYAYYYDEINNCYSPATAAVTATINTCSTCTTVGGTAAYTGGTVCSTSNIGTITLTGQTGNVVKWQTSTNGGTSWTDISGTLGKTTYNFINAVNNQQFRAILNSGAVGCPDVPSTVVTITTSTTACTTTACSYNSGTFSPTISANTNPTYTQHVVLVNPTTGVMQYVTAANSTAFTGIAQGDYIMYVVMYDNTVTPTTTVTSGTNISALTGCFTVSDPLITKVCINQAPVITSAGTATTPENVSTTTAVYTATATDPNLGQTLTFAFETGGADNAKFTIDPTTGAVKFVASPDFELPTDANGDNIYEIIVKVCDNGTPQYCDVKTVQITVTDIIECGGFVAPTVSIAQPVCGSTTGIITVTAPSTGITYSFDNGTTFQASATSNALTSGTYLVKIKDNTTACVSPATSSVINAPLAVPATPTATVAQPTCAVATGTITVTTPSTNVTYSFDNGTTYQATATSNALASGTYSIKVKSNANGCVSPVLSKTINAQPATPSLPIVSVTQPTCTSSTGSLTITQPTDAGMTYSIDGTTYTNTTGVFNNVAAGTYSVTAKSASGCLSSSASATINAIFPAPTVTVVQPSCTVATGSFTVIDPIGAGFSYSVDGVDYSNTSGVFSNLSPATYNVTAKNASGCVSSATAVVIFPPVPTPIIATNQPNCTTATGTITITTPTTGVTYSFDNGLTFQASNTLTNVVAGTYQIILKNSADVCVTTPKEVVVHPQPTVGCNCNNVNGTLTASASNQNTGVDYTQKYVLTDNSGVIVQTATTPSFTGLVSNTYAIYAINYKTTEGVNGLTIGQNIAGVNSPCLDVTAPLFYTVCIPVFVCNNNSGNITAQISGQNTGALFTQSYALTDENGVIVKLSTTPNFTGLVDGKYKMYGVNYETSGGMTGLTIGQNISGLTGACLNVTDALLFQVCIVPEICNNRIDDDGDGLIDCEDVTDCPSCGCDNTTGTITFTNTGQTTTGYTQVYVLTDSTGKILNTNTVATFTGLSTGRYRVYAINYRTADGITGITIGANISGVTGLCFDKSLPLLFKVCLCVTMNLKVMLEGPYQTATSDMQTILNQRGLLPGQTPIGQFAVATPAGQPYNTAPWNYSGTEGATRTTYPATVVDWVLVSLRADATTTNNVFRVTGLLHKDGTISFESPCFDIANGNYYVVIEHRNHVGVMSPNQVPIINGVLTHDFTVNDSYVVLNPPSFGQKQKGSKWVMYAGDGKKDTQNTNFDVNFQDNQYWKLQSGIFDQYRFGDFNMDADVNFADNYMWKFNSGKYSAVPH